MNIIKLSGPSDQFSSNITVHKQIVSSRVWYFLGVVLFYNNNNKKRYPFDDFVIAAAAVKRLYGGRRCSRISILFWYHYFSGPLETIELINIIK